MSKGVVTRVVDRQGNTLRSGDMGGDFFVPAFPSIQDFSQHARDVKAMTMHPGDVILVNYPKSGTHWLSSIVHMLMEGSADSYFKDQLGVTSFLDKTPITEQTIAPADKPRFFMTHLKFQYLPTQMQEKRVKLIYLQRNPKDTWVSMFNSVTRIGLEALSYKGSWDDFFDAMMSSGLWYGNWFDYVLDWERDMVKGRESGMPILVSSYEDLKKDPVGQIQKLDQFLGYNRGRELCERIAQACQFSTMKSALQEQWKGSNSPHVDTMLLFYRKGEVGDWKNWFTVAQNEQFDRAYRDRMQGSELRYNFE